MTTSEQWHLSPEAARLYERHVATFILGPWAPRLVDAGGVKPGHHVLDVACGTGIVARAAREQAGRAGRVAGIDLNPGMIAVAQSLPQALGMIDWQVRSALDLGFEDGLFDVVLCQQGLQFFSDKPRALREMHRVLRSHGRLALSVWNSAGLYNSAVAEALGEALGREIADQFIASRRVPSRCELNSLAQAAGFADVEVSIARISIHLPHPEQFCLDHLRATPVASGVSAASADVRARLGTTVRERLREFADGDGVTYPEETHVLTARAT
jgi:ubiquinone/menaquinone biosynthesis C-methylase UbiE